MFNFLPNKANENFIISSGMLYNENVYHQILSTTKLIETITKIGIFNSSKVSYQIILIYSILFLGTKI